MIHSILGKEVEKMEVFNERLIVAIIMLSSELILKFEVPLYFLLTVLFVNTHNRKQKY